MVEDQATPPNAGDIEIRHALAEPAFAMANKIIAQIDKVVTERKGLEQQLAMKRQRIQMLENAAEPVKTFEDLCQRLETLKAQNESALAAGKFFQATEHLRHGNVDDIDLDALKPGRFTSGANATIQTQYIAALSQAMQHYRDHRDQPYGSYLPLSAACSLGSDLRSARDDADNLEDAIRVRTAPIGFNVFAEDGLSLPEKRGVMLTLDSMPVTEGFKEYLRLWARGALPPTRDTITGMRNHIQQSRALIREAALEEFPELRPTKAPKPATP